MALPLASSAGPAFFMAFSRSSGVEPFCAMTIAPDPASSRADAHSNDPMERKTASSPVVSEGRRPSDSPTRALARRCAGSLPPPPRLRRDLAEAPSARRRAGRVVRLLRSHAGSTNLTARRKPFTWNDRSETRRVVLAGNAPPILRQRVPVVSDSDMLGAGVPDSDSRHRAPPDCRSVTTHYLAFDLGAESGRAMLGRLQAGVLEITEIHRFANEPLRD